MFVNTAHIEIRGMLRKNAPLGPLGWFKCGGSAEVLFKPDDIHALQNFIQLYQDMDINVFGALSNTIIRDGGLCGATIRLGRNFSHIKILDDYCVNVGAFALDANVAKIAAEAGIKGLEFLSGIPGTIGGALRMNAGCYGVEMKDILVSCEVLDPSGELHTLTPEKMQMGYRHNNLPQGWIFLNATLKGIPGNAADIKAQISNIKERREESQPIREKTGGSTFANPTPLDLDTAGLSPDTKVWQLIDDVGGRGLKFGGAQMSEKHCNFMINTGTATAADLENLGEEIKRRVLDHVGINLRWEIRRIGVQ